MPLYPRHIAVIMDGNGRWAQMHSLPRREGHRKGIQTLQRILYAAQELSIEYITLYTFSAENWYRPQEEVEDLMLLLQHYLEKEIHNLHHSGMRLRIIGLRQKLPQKIITLIEYAENLTLHNTSLHVTIALSYGARQEITQAFNLFIKKHNPIPQHITTTLFEQYLETSALPDPDLLIRTGGEKRLSNFLLWQLAYAELIFVDTLWPDFGPSDLQDAIYEFQRRERRYGIINI